MAEAAGLEESIGGDGGGAWRDPTRGTGMLPAVTTSTFMPDGE